MKRILLAASALLGLVTAAHAGGHGYGTGSNSSHTHVGGYYRSNGTYVGAHERTSPNGTQYDNYGTRGNYNPYTGETGTRSPRY